MRPLREGREVFQHGQPVLPRAALYGPGRAAPSGGRPFVELVHYLVVYAPRQMGKTTALQALTRELSAAGGLVALYLSCESAAAVVDDYAAAELIVLSAIREAAFA